MKRLLVYTLSFFLLIFIALPAAFAEGDVPKPTPPPVKVIDGGVPAHIFASNTISQSIRN